MGLIHTAPGYSGGIILAKAPSEINMREIVSALEGPLCLVECVNDASVCDRIQTCVTRDLWIAASNKIVLGLESVTLKDMIERQGTKGTSHPNYDI